MSESVPTLRPALKRQAPGLAREQSWWEAGADIVVGIDEVGRGAWAGPLAVGAAVLPRERRVYKVRDSKMLTEPEREALFERVAGWCRTWAIGLASPQECDELGMSEAQRLAANRAIEGLGVDPDRILIDGSWDFVGRGITETVVKGDATCLSIAAASILAKVSRDRMMRAESEHFPAYGFDGNKGYPSPDHQAAFHWLGPCSIHRTSWVFMDGVAWNGVRRRVRIEPQGALFDAQGRLWEA